MGLYEDILAQIGASPQYQQQTTPVTSNDAGPGGGGAPAGAAPAVTYTPDGAAREPGFYNPTNEYDTGRAGEKNGEKVPGSGDVEDWDYDARRPRDPNAAIDPNTGYYVFAGGGAGGAPGGAGTIGNVQSSFMQPTANQQGWNGQGTPPALQRNPQLPQHPLGAFSDARYEAETAMLRADIAKAYNDILQQLGYSDEKGGFVKGTTEIEADRRKRDLERNSMLAGEEVTKQSQREGTLFSGVRGTQQARAQFPFIQAIGDLETDTPRALAGLYSRAMGTLDDYTRRQNLLIAEAAERAAARMTNSRRSTSSTGSQPPGAAGPGYTPDANPVLGAGTTASPQDYLMWATAAGFEWDPNTGTFVPQGAPNTGQTAGGVRL